MKSATGSAYDQSEYFYDMLEQLLAIGRAAGGDALVDAALIGGLLASRNARFAAEAVDRRLSA